MSEQSSTPVIYITKYPMYVDEYYEHGIDLTPRLATNETIASSVWTPDSTLTLGNYTNDDGIVMAWFDPSIIKEKTLSKNVATTSAGRKLVSILQCDVVDVTLT